MRIQEQQCPRRAYRQHAVIIISRPQTLLNHFYATRHHGEESCFTTKSGRCKPERGEREHIRRVRDWVLVQVSESEAMDPPILITAPGERMSEAEAERAALDLVRAMGEGDIVEGLGKLEMLQVLTICGVIGLRSFNTACPS